MNGKNLCASLNSAVYFAAEAAWALQVHRVPTALVPRGSAATTGSFQGPHYVG